MISSDGSPLDRSRTAENHNQNPNHNHNRNHNHLKKLRCWFDHFHSVLLKEICAHDDTLRPLPPILGDDGRCADLFKLFLVVREKGGCNVVSRNGLWSSVAEESGLGLNFAAAVKLVYIKYLDTFERWLDRIFVDETSEICCLSFSSDVGRYLMELQAEFKGFLKSSAASKNDDNKDDDDEKLLSYGDDDDVMVLDPDMVHQENFSRKKRKKCDDNGECEVIELDGENLGSSDENSNGGLVDSGAGNGNGTTEAAINDDALESLMGILSWVKVVGRDPCDPDVGSLPEPSKWKNPGNQEIWKQVLLAREAIFLKRQVDSSSEQSNWQVIFLH